MDRFQYRRYSHITKALKALMKSLDVLKLMYQRKPRTYVEGSHDPVRMAKFLGKVRVKNCLSRASAIVAQLYYIVEPEDNDRGSKLRAECREIATFLHPLLTHLGSFYEIPPHLQNSIDVVDYVAKQGFQDSDTSDCAQDLLDLVCSCLRRENRTFETLRLYSPFSFFALWLTGSTIFDLRYFFENYLTTHAKPVMIGISHNSDSDHIISSSFSYISFSTSEAYDKKVRRGYSLGKVYY